MSSCHAYTQGLAAKEPVPRQTSTMPHILRYPVHRISQPKLSTCAGQCSLSGMTFLLWPGRVAAFLPGLNYTPYSADIGSTSLLRKRVPRWTACACTCATARVLVPWSRFMQPKTDGQQNLIQSILDPALCNSVIRENPICSQNTTSTPQQTCR